MLILTGVDVKYYATVDCIFLLNAFVSKVIHSSAATLISSEPEEMKAEGSCKLIRAHDQVPGTSLLFIGYFYRPPDENDPGYLDQLQSCLSKISTGALTWLEGNFNLGDIDWTTDSVKQYANKPGLCHQLLRISKDNFLDQLVLEPTRITEDAANILDLFFSNNQSLVNRVDIIPGISDHEVVYVESSLRPPRAATPPRKVFCHNKADFDTLKAKLRIARKEFESMEPTSTTKVSKGAKIRNRYNQVPHLTQDTNGKVTNSQQTPQTGAKRSALSQQVTTKHI